MNIKVKDFIIEQSEYHFDLKRIVKSRRIGDGTISNLQGEEYEKFVDCGYGMTLDRCIEEIIHLTLLDRKELVELNQYIQEYKNLKHEITLIVHGEPVNIVIDKI